MNGIGTTECLSYRWYFVDRTTPIEGTRVPLGYPLEGKETLLLDDSGQPVAPGPSSVAEGEIAVRSRYLSPGYWRRPDLTDSAFLPDAAAGGVRVYRTGDLGRLQADGMLVHLGRKDLQVKIHGYRIELEEIETALRLVPGVTHAAVVACEERPGQRRIAACLVATEDVLADVERLRQHLGRTLPDYMVPSLFFKRDSLPRLPNGKLDRRTLQAEAGQAFHDAGARRLDAPVVVPRTPSERALAEIWSDVLRLDRIGVADRFLDLGGDSLQAMQIVNRVLRSFQVELPLRRLLESPTVAEMAEVLDSYSSTERD